MYKYIFGKKQIAFIVDFLPHIEICFPPMLNKLDNLLLDQITIWYKATDSHKCTHYSFFGVFLIEWCTN